MEPVSVAVVHCGAGTYVRLRKGAETVPPPGPVPQHTPTEGVTR
ncbi:hypothetical protein [Streptomyces sp. NPDC058664]